MELEIKNNWMDLEYWFDGEHIPTDEIKRVKVRWPNGKVTTNKAIKITDRGTYNDMGHEYPYSTDSIHVAAIVRGLTVHVPLPRLQVLKVNP